VVEFVGTAGGLSQAPMLRHLRLLSGVGALMASREAFRDDRFPFSTHRLSSVLLGTTNHCNASCPHCPANKPMLAHQPTGVMSMAMFEKLLDGLGEIALEDRVWFGVFGEPFLDPTLEAKLEMLRRRFPDIHVGVSTNAAAIDLARAERIFELLSTLQIHVEAVTPARYDALMQPLRAAEALPKIDHLVKAFPGRVQITSPLHRGNLTEADAIRERWGAHGVPVVFVPLLNRSTIRTGARKMALWPVPGFAQSDLVEVLTVDWDGAVLATCDDFLRRQPLGSLEKQSLAEIMSGSARRTLHENLSAFRWAELPSFRDAVVDCQARLGLQSQSPNGAVTRKWVLPPDTFRLRADARWAGNRIVVETPSPASSDAPVIYGPYLSLAAGRYSVEIALARDSGEPEQVWSEALAYGHKVYLRADLPKGEELLRLVFDHDRPDMPVEFRTFVAGAGRGVRFGGAVLFKVA
jgi:hypothetical protein